MSWQSITKFLKWLIRKIPVFGGVFFCSFKAHKKAFAEVIVGLIFSTMPIWLGGLVAAIHAWPDPQNHLSFFSLFFSAMKNLVSNGELLMLAAATSGPTFYMGLSSEKPDEEESDEREGETQTETEGSDPSEPQTPIHAPRPFPGQLMHMLCVVLLVVVAAVLFFTNRGSPVNSTSGMIGISAAFYSLSLLFLYCAAVYNADRFSWNAFEQAMFEQQAFQSRYHRHRGAP